MLPKNYPLKARYFLIFLLLLTIFGCIRDEYSIDDLSLHAELKMELAAPVIKGIFELNDFLETNYDSVLTIKNDTIFYSITKENVFSVEAPDFFPEIDNSSSTYTIQADVDIPIFGVDTIDLSVFKPETYFPITDEEEIIIDSLYIRDGGLDVTITNRYEHDLIIELFSSSLFEKTTDDNYSEKVNIDGSGEKLIHIDFSEYKIEPFINEYGETCVKMQFSPILINSGSDVLLKENGIDVEFQINDIESIDYLFGYTGQSKQSIANNFSLPSDLPLADNISGKLSLTEPRIKLVYHQSFGLPLAVDMKILSYNDADEPVEIIPEAQTIGYAEDYLNPYFSDSIIWNENNTSNLDQLLSYPFGDSLVFMADVETNPDGYSDQEFNYITYNSALGFDVEIELPMVINADLSYTDTLSNPLYDNENETGATFNYLYLHYLFDNTFPLAFEADVILYDSLTNKTMETIPLNSAEKPFIEAAPVSNGSVSGFKTTKGQVLVSEKAFNQVLNDATHLIIQSTVQTTNNTSVLISPDSELNFKIGFEVSGHISTNLNNEK